MFKLNRLLPLCMLISLICIMLSTDAFATRENDEIEVYKLGNTSITVKWTPYDAGVQTVEKYSVGYKVHGAPVYTYIDVSASVQNPDYSSINNEFTKKINDLTSGTIYDISIDTYLQGNPVPVSFYIPIQVMTKTVIDKTVQNISNPYGNDSVGHIDFSFTAPNEETGGIMTSVNKSNIEGYRLLVSASEGQIYSGGQPYKVLYNNATGKYDIFRVTTLDQPLTYNDTQFSFNSQLKNNKDLLAFALYKTNQPSNDNFNLSSVYYVLIQPIFKVGSGYENVITDATARYETIETISTLLPLTVTQISNDLIKVEFSSVVSGSMTYDIYKGRMSTALTKTHTEYDDGSRLTIQYFNKLDDPLEGDVYYFRVVVSNGVTSKIASITISLNPNIAPVIENIKVEKILTDTVNKYSDIVVSWDKPISEDLNRTNLTYRVNLNTDTLNQVYDNDVVYDTNGDILLNLDGKIVLNSKKDINNNNIVYKGLPVVFERIGEIKVPNLSDPAVVYTGADPIGNFLATGCNYYRISRDGQQIIRTIYRINGQNFLTNADIPIYNGQPHTIYNSKLEGELATDYKNKIELNTIYYLKIDSYNSSNSQISDYSLTVSFTTPTDVVDTVPAPSNLAVESIQTDSIGLVWDMINESIFDDDDVTYEVYLSEEGDYSESNFYRIKNPVITDGGNKKHVVISSYSFDDDILKQIQSNSVYLFKIRAIWSTQDGKGNNILIYSKPSEILPVTTKRIAISDPDMAAPPAPIDFVATSITSKVANFRWTKVDEFSTYRIVKTSKPIEPLTPLSVTGNGVIDGFALNGITYNYSDANLVSNALYYFSIRSEVEVIRNDQEGNPVPVILSSVWISIPITTILVEPPTELTLVSRSIDGYSVTISWKGKASLGYETAKKNDSIKNYQISETIAGTVGDSSIKVFQLTLYNLRPNTKYFIKVRAKDPSGNMYSKYTEPIEVRTEFSQSEYNFDIENREKKEIITTVGQDWLKGAVQEVGIDTKRFELWIKEEKAANQARNSASIIYDIRLDNSSVINNIAYIPLDLINTLNQTNKCLKIDIQQGSFYIKPGDLDAEALSEIFANTNVKSRMLIVQINQLSSSEARNMVTTNDYLASGVSNVSLKLAGYNKTEDDIDRLITQRIDRIINEETFWVWGRTIEQIKDQMRDKIKKEIKQVINDAYISDTILSLDNNKIRIIYNYNLDPSAKSSRYVAYIKNGNISREIEGQTIDYGKFEFETSLLGNIAILGKNGPSDIMGHKAEQSIKVLISKYNFWLEITNGKFRPNSLAKKKEAISFMVNVLSPKGQEYEGLSNIEKAQKLGILEEFPAWGLDDNLTREELAYLLARVYQVKTGIDIEKLYVGSNQYIEDQSSIAQKYIISVYMALENDFMKNTLNNLFYPNKQVTRADVAVGLVKLLDKLGEI